MSQLARVAWLFVKGDQTIHVVSSDDGLSLSTNGPLRARNAYSFGDHGTATAFLRLYERSLVDSGWALQAFIERRGTAQGAVPETGDRRAGDRRASVAH